MIKKETGDHPGGYRCYESRVKFDTESEDSELFLAPTISSLHLPLGSCSAPRDPNWTWIGAEDGPMTASSPRSTEMNCDETSF
jgi:hypothetical protein